MMIRQNLKLIGLMLLCSLIAYAQVLPAYFLSDDFHLIKQIMEQGAFGMWSAPQGLDCGFFRPLSSISLFLDYHLWGTGAGGFHLTNIILHGLNGFLVALVARTLPLSCEFDARARKLFALASGLLFVLLPSHSEAVAWISGRTDVIAAFFALSSILAYHGYVHRRKLGLLVLAQALLFVSLLAKESAICLPAYFILLELFVALQRRESGLGWRKMGGTALAFSLVVSAYLLCRKHFIGTLVGGYGRDAHLKLAPLHNLGSLLKAWLRSFLPGMPYANKTVLAIAALSAVLAIGGAAALATSALRRQCTRALRLTATWEPSFFLIAFCLLLAPAINLTIFFHTTEGERLLYLPSTFSVLFLAYLLVRLIHTQAVRHAALSFMGGACLLGLVGVNAQWAAAGRISNQIIRQLLSMEAPRSAILLNLPDSLRGAYIFRNGLLEAMAINGRYQYVGQLATMSQHRICQADEPVRITRQGEDVAIRLTHPSSFIPDFIPADAGLDQPPKIQQLGADRLSLKLKPPTGGRLVFYYSQGRLEKLF